MHLVVSVRLSVRLWIWEFTLKSKESVIRGLGRSTFDYFQIGVNRLLIIKSLLNVIALRSVLQKESPNGLVQKK